MAKLVSPPPSDEAVPPDTSTGRFSTFSSLRDHPNFRLYWIGACLSNVGTWMQSVAQGWLVYQLTGSALDLGIVTFAGTIPVLFLSLVGGALADRVDRRWLMIWSQTGMMILAFILTALTFLGIETVIDIVVLAFFNGICNAFNIPVRQSIIVDLVPRKDLQNALALNSAQFQTSRLFGPALAGIVLALTGPAWCFLINGISFLTVIAALYFLKVPPRVIKPTKSMLRNVGEGLRYVKNTPTILGLILIALVPGIFGQPYQVMMPALALGVLNSNATGLGLLQSGAGAGALVGALFIASLTRSRIRGRIQLGALVLYGIMLLALSQSRWLPLSILFVFGVGLASMSYNSLNQTFVQTLAQDDMRGRVTSVLMLSTIGIQPLGAILAGLIGENFGVPYVFVVGGIVCVLVGVLATRMRGAALAELS
jgi:MFS family permease